MKSRAPNSCGCSLPFLFQNALAALSAQLGIWWGLGLSEGPGFYSRGSTLEARPMICLIFSFRLLVFVVFLSISQIPAEARGRSAEGVRTFFVEVAFQYSSVSQLFDRNGIRFCTTEYESVLLYRIRFCTTEYDSVLQNTILYYRICFSITEYESVVQSTILLQNTILYYRVRFCNTDHDSVPQNTIMYYRIRLCITEYDYVLQNMFLC